MEFIQRMRKREYIEMGIKTLIALLVAFVAVVLLEGMIYSIQLNALKKSTKSISTQTSIAYCIKEGEDEYFVIYYNSEDGTWCGNNGTKSKVKCEEGESSVKETYYRAPTAFELTINDHSVLKAPVHYAIMAVIALGVIGYFSYRFVRLVNAYNKIEDDFNKKGTIEIVNM